MPADLRAIVIETAKHWPDEAIYVGCSGNYTIERVLDELGRPLHSNDVQGYSSALGWFLSTGETPFTLKEEWKDELEWIEPYLDGGIGTAATLMLGTVFLPLVGSTKLYQMRTLEAYKQQFPRLHEKTVERLENLPLRLASYSAMDVMDFMEDVVPVDAPVAMFPPFYGGDYEEQFESFDTFFDWPAPEFEEWNDDARERLIEMVADRPHWVLGLHIEQPGYERHLRGRVQTTNRGVPIHVYGSGNVSRIVQPRQQVEFIAAPKIGFNDDLDGEMKIHPLTGGQFQAIRSQFMSKTILPGQPVLAFGVTVGGVLVGSFAYGQQSGDKDCIYLLSDFPVSWSKYKHLAKLIVIAGMSAEAKFLVQRSMSHRIRRIETTAFSNRPVSMKYRGLMKLLRRGEGDDGHHQHKLQYGAPIGEWTLAEGLAMWQKRWSAERDREETK